jgi:predicted dehydrogenase
MDMKPVRIAVVGCGSIGTKRHIPEYAANKNAKLVAFCDVVLSRADAMAKVHGGKACADWRDVIALPEVDAVSVCTPNALHAPISIAASNAGKHVLCEKPMAVSASEAQAMIDAAQASGKVLMIGQNQRMAPLHVRAKQILKSGLLGKVLTFKTTFGHGGPESWGVDGAGSWFFQKEKAFVGAMGDLGVHKADLIRWLLDDEVVEVAAYVDALANKPKSNVDDNAVCLFRMKSGAMGTMTASWSYSPTSDNGTVLYCEKGILRIDSDPTFNVIVETRGEKQCISTKALQTNEAGGQTDSGVISAFLESITKKKACPIPGEEGARSLAVILACLESSETGRFVKVEDMLAVPA